MLYEIHMLKNYPPTNLNRDDTGAPKTCLFGGVNRGRISSQCLKRSWRTSEIFQQAIGKENLGIRTKSLPQLVGEKLREMGVSSAYIDLFIPKISKIAKKDKKKNGEKEEKEDEGSNTTKQIIFYSPQDIQSVADAAKKLLDGCESEKEVKKLKIEDLQAGIKDAQSRAITLDIALFGRMVTSDAFRDVEAGMQVAHAISTNKVAVESDYFTAMDDMLSGKSIDEIGAGMIGDTDFNSSCYYIYAALDTDILKKNLEYTENAEELIQKALPVLLQAMAFTNPSGKQNSFAGHVLPGAMLVECKETKIPTSLVNAYVEPVRGGKDLLESSIARLAEESNVMVRNFGLEVKKRLWFCLDKYTVAPPDGAEVCKTLLELVNAVAETLD